MSTTSNCCTGATPVHPVRRSLRRGERACGLGAGASALLFLLLPKCPMCLVGYASVAGLGAWAGGLRPLAGLAGLVLAVVWWRLKWNSRTAARRSSVT